MEQLFVKNIGEVLKNKKALEENLNVKISVRGNVVTINGESLDEYVAELIFDAVSFGFSVRKSLLLKNEDCILKKVHIKEYTKRDLKDVKARLIGTHGRTRRAFSRISDCDIMIRDGEVGIIGRSDDVSNVENAVINIIKGSKQGNMYKYLEKMNRLKKEDDFNLN